MLVLKTIVCVGVAMASVPIVCGILGQPQSHFEQKGQEAWAIGIGLTAGVLGFGASQLVGRGQ